MSAPNPEPDRPTTPLHADAPTTRFSDRADDYAKHRPSYPPEAIQAILSGLGPPIALTAADIGAGTGISSVLLADRGVRVFAVEPNAEMRAAATPHPNVEYRDGVAEHTRLPGAMFDLILCAQAFHWFDHGRALREFRRILRARGRIALIWNNRDETDPFTRIYGAAVAQASSGHPAAARVLDPGPAFEAAGFPTPRLCKCPSVQSLDFAGLLGRALSASYVPRSGPGLDRLRTDLRSAFDHFADPNGHVSIRYSTDVYLADCSTPPALR